eukprot:scaffold64193_cov24-Phaeocystis_antarctica.AAC.1
MCRGGLRCAAMCRDGLRCAAMGCDVPLSLFSFASSRGLSFPVLAMIAAQASPARVIAASANLVVRGALPETGGARGRPDTASGSFGCPSGRVMAVPEKIPRVRNRMCTSGIELLPSWRATGDFKQEAGAKLNPGPSPGNGGELETSLSHFTRNLAR